MAEIDSREAVIGKSGGHLGGEADETDFADWLQGELGEDVSVVDFLARLQRRRFDASTTLYRQGEQAEAIDLVATGRLVIELVGPDGRPRHLRTLTTRTVVGEMGFIRRVPRSANVVTEGAVTLYTRRVPPSICYAASARAGRGV